MLLLAPTYGDSGMASNWEAVRFGDLLITPLKNGLYKEKQHHGRGAKIINMGELFRYPRLGAVPMKRVVLTPSEEDRFLVRPNDLIFARRSLVAEGAGKCCIVLDVDEPTTFESSIIRARPDGERADASYLYYFFNSPTGLYHLDTIRRQVAVAGITGTDLANLIFPLPPLATQKAIGLALATLDDKIELNRRMSETLEAMARALFTQWFVAFDPVRAKSERRDTGLPREVADLFPDSFEDSELGEIPKGWAVRSLSDFADLNPEVWSKSSRPDAIEYVDLSNTKWGRIEAVAAYERDAAPSRAQRVLRVGDTIMGTVRPGNGSYALVGLDGLTGSTGFAVLRPTKPEYTQLVYLACTDRRNIDRLAHVADGGAYPAVRPDVVAATALTGPGIPLIEVFSKLTAPLLERIEVSNRESETLMDLRDLLLPALISGDLPVDALTSPS